MSDFPYTVENMNFAERPNMATHFCHRSGIWLMVREENDLSVYVPETNEWRLTGLNNLIRPVAIPDIHIKLIAKFIKEGIFVKVHVVGTKSPHSFLVVGRRGNILRVRSAVADYKGEFLVSLEAVTTPMIASWSPVFEGDYRELNTNRD